MINFGGAESFPLLVRLNGQEFGAFRVEAPGERVELMFAEFEVWAPSESGELRNIAIRRPVRQSSIARKGSGPKRGNTGVVKQDEGVRTSVSADPWWKVELGGPKPISHVVLHGMSPQKPETLANIRIWGRRKGTWHLLFDQESVSDRQAVLTDTLSLVIARLDSVVDHMALPRVAGHPPGTQIAEHNADAVAPFWEERSRLERIREIAIRLRSIVARGLEVDQEVLEMSRVAADGCLPASLLSRARHIWLLRTDDTETLHVRAPSPLAISPVVAVSPINEVLEPGLETGGTIWPVGRPLDDVGTPISTPASSYALKIDGEIIKESAWEIWARAQGTPDALVYDALLATRSLVVIHQVLRSLGVAGWTNLESLLRVLELETRYRPARWLARNYVVDDPGEEVLAASVNEIEVRSFLDPGRDVISRSKHGYRKPFRFRDLSAYASGTEFLLNLLRRDDRFSHVFPVYGTLLGFVREGTFIPHDDDADLLIVTRASGREGMIEIYDELLDYLGGRGFRMFRRARRLPGRPLPVAFHVEGERVHIDVFFSYEEEGEQVAFNPANRSFAPINSELLKTGRQVRVEGKTFDIPVEAEQLLTLWYGSSWATPDESLRVGYSFQRRTKAAQD